MSAQDPCIRMGEYTLRFEDGPEMGDGFEQRARLELRETPDRRAQAIEQLRDMIRGEEGLVLPLDNEIFLLSYLRPCKFYPESAFERIKKMYKFRPKHPKYFHQLVPSRDRNVFEQCLLTVLPNRDQHGSRILMVEAGDKWKPKECSLAELIRGVLLVLEAAVLEPRTQVSGAVVLIDLRGMGLHHVWQFSPQFASMLVEWVQDLIPCRIKAVHLVNQPYVFNMIFNIFKPFFREKLRNRIHFHGEDRASLVRHIDAKCVPTQFGGDMRLPADQGLELFRLISLYEDKYQKTSEYGYVTKQKGKKEGKIIS